MSMAVPTLDRATQQARDEAQRSGAPVYVIEMENEAADDYSLSDLSPEERLAAWQGAEQMAREAEEDARLWREDPAAARAAGMLPPWEEMAGPEVGDEDEIDPHDPIVFSTTPATTAAILVRMLGPVELLRVAHPDGRVAAIADPDGECARLLVEYADYLRDHPPL